MKLNLKKFGTLIVIMNIFLCGVLTNEVVLLINAMVVAAYFFCGKVKIKKQFLVVLFFLFIHGIINIILTNCTASGLIKQILGISISFLTFYSILDEDADIKQFFYIYLKISVVMAGLIIAQQIAYLLHIKFIYDLSWLSNSLHTTYSEKLYRASALMVEPAAFCEIMAPAMYVAIYTLVIQSKCFLKYWQAGIILVGYILAFSSVGYVGILFSLFSILVIEKRITIKTMLIPIISVISFGILFWLVPDFRERVIDTIALLEGQTSIGKNVSSTTFVLHLKTSFTIFLMTYGMGSGIGSYSKMFFKASGDSYFYSNNVFNIDDANSLLFRMMAELGIWGIVAIILFLKKYYAPFIKRNVEYELINKAVLCFLVLRLFRSGHYFNDAMFFFFILYIRSQQRSILLENN